MSGCAVINVPLSLSREVELREFVVKPAEGRFVTDKILLIDISGLITGESPGGLLSRRSNTVASVRDALDKAKKDNDIKAVVLRIDSSGGEVTASDVIYEQVRRFRAQRAEGDEPVAVLASMLGVAASGGYYCALAADRIYAHPTSLTGSIGVIATFPNLDTLIRKIGVDMRIIKSAEKKDMSSMWRDFTPEEREILQQTIDEMYQRFVDVVTENRGQLDRETVVKLADGRVYTAQQAVDNHLIDGIAYLDDVIDKAKGQAKIDDAHVVVYRRASRFDGSVYSQSPMPAPRVGSQINLLQINGESMFGPWPQPGFYYLWMP
jgi:protease-4